MNGVGAAQAVLFMVGTVLLAAALWGVERLGATGLGRGERLRLGIVAGGAGLMAASLVGLGVAGANAACESLLLVAIVGLGGFGVADTARKLARGWSRGSEGRRP